MQTNKFVDLMEGIGFCMPIWYLKELGLKNKKEM
jgi:hypothetical protein